MADQSINHADGAKESEFVSKVLIDFSILKGITRELRRGDVPVSGGPRQQDLHSILKSLIDLRRPTAASFPRGFPANSA
jgi:hypothetical protein